MIATPLTPAARPLYPIECPICGTLVGSYYRDGLSLRAHARACSDRCQTLWQYARGRGQWRDLPPDLRQVYLAAGALDAQAQR